MTLSKILKSLILFLFAIALFAACNKEDIQTSEDFTQEEEMIDYQLNDDDDDDDDDHDCQDDDIYELAECIEFVFPVTIILPDTTEVTVADEDELEDALETWYDDNPESEELPDLKYPVTVILEEGTESVINNEEELEALVVENINDS